MKIVAMIPSRLAATRLPDKPLIDICGKPMIQWVWERAMACDVLSDVVVATPDEAIMEAVAQFGGRAVLTSMSHRSGTDRLAEAAADSDADVIVNIQGDEPLIDPVSVRLAVDPFLDPDVQMTSLMCPCPAAEWESPSTVKVVCGANGDALYFSRSRIPFPRSTQAGPMQHIGFYAYRRSELLRIARLPATPLEHAEGLEQLRVLEHGRRIRMVRIERAPLSVDTPEDLAQVRRLLAAV